MISYRVPRVPLKGSIRITIRHQKGYYDIGAPYYTYNIVGPKTLF